MEASIGAVKSTHLRVKVEKTFNKMKMQVRKLKASLLNEKSCQCVLGESDCAVLDDGRW